MPDLPNWTEISIHDMNMISLIVDRAMSLELGERFRLVLDISTTHLVCPLNLVLLLNCNERDFILDIQQISENIDRTRYRLTPGYRPKSARTTS